MRYAFLVIVVLTTLFVAACGSTATPTQAPATQAPVAQQPTQTPAQPAATSAPISGSTVQLPEVDPLDGDG